MSKLKSSVVLTTLQNLSQVLLCQHVETWAKYLLCQHFKTPPPNFFFACGRLSQRCVYGHLLSPKNPQFFFRLRRAVTKMCIWLFVPPPKTPNFFSPAAGCYKDLYMAILPQKSPQFFSPSAGCHKDVYGHLPLLKKKPIVICFPQKTPNFFRLRRAVTKMCIWPFVSPPKNL